MDLAKSLGSFCSRCWNATRWEESRSCACLSNRVSKHFSQVVMVNSTRATALCCWSVFGAKKTHGTSAPLTRLQTWL
ncbi:hypothetical protein V5799_012907 [Amblyomma americanum]|uniref:Uncharacterized protein n=1 Tax=Amblyomma americanum TaxID=6943 RepID=A0AAQ4E7I8_AMBAM